MKNHPMGNPSLAFARAFLAMPFCVITAASLSAAGVDADFEAPAEFRVTEKVALPAEAHLPFGAESHPEHNIISHEPYETIVRRTAFDAAQTSPDRINVEHATDLTSYNKYGDGYWDGARARVYRMMDGKWVKVREDVVPEGGFSTAMWRVSSPLGVRIGLQGRYNVLAPEIREATFTWNSSWQGGRNYYLGVAAIDAAGNLSPIEWAEVFIPEDRGKAEKVKKPKTKSFRPKGEDDAAPAPAADVRVKLHENGSNATLNWSYPQDEDIVGFAAFYAIHHPDEHTGGHILLSESPDDPEKHVQAGDHVVLELEAVNRLRSQVDPRLANLGKFNAKRHHGFVYPDEDPDMDWRLLDYADFPDMPRPENFEALHSQSFLRYTLKNGASAAPHNYSIGSIEDGRPTLKPGVPYVAEIRVRYEGDDPDATAKFSLSGGVLNAPENADEVLEETVEPTADWQTVRLEFTNAIPWHTENHGNSAQWKLEMQGDGIFDVDELRIYEADTPFGEVLWDDSLNEEARKANMSVFRFMWLEEEGYRLRDILHDFHQFLAYCERADTAPFFAMQHGLNEGEWRGLTAFLAAPYDPEADHTDPASPNYWAHQRAAFGRTEPWVEAFDMLILQVNNQPYYNIFNPWAFVGGGPVDAVTGEDHPRGYAAGAMAEYCFNIMKSSPAWTPEMEEKMRLAIQIQSANVRHEEPQTNGYGVHSVRGAPSAGVVLSALYNGGWDGAPNDFTVANLNEGIFTSLAFNHTTNLNWAKNLPALREYMKEQGFWPEGAILGGYELGPGYQLPRPGMKREIVDLENAVGKSLAVATANLDNFLTRAYYGTALQNFFMLERRANFWSSHQEVVAGGHAYPVWKLLDLWLNEGMPGSFLEVETLSTPTLDIPDIKNRGAVEDAPMTAVYATRDGDRFNVAVLSRKQDGTVDLNQDGTPDYEFGEAWTPVTLQLPFNQAGKVTLYKMAGDPRANNVHEENVFVEKVENVPFADGKITLNQAVTGESRDGLPPAATMLLVFEQVK